jgi:BMFP domain-containing protein YqiC
MTDPKKLAEEAKRLAETFAEDFKSPHQQICNCIDRCLCPTRRISDRKRLHAAIDQLSALAEKAERLEVALKAIIQADDAQELEQADIERGRAALSTGEPK